LPLSPPYFFEEELAYDKLMERRTVMCEFIAAQADPRNYEWTWREDLGAHVGEFRPPAHLEAKEAARRSQLEDVDQIYRLLAWGMAPLHEGKLGAGLSPEDAALLARDLAQEDDASQPPADDASENRARAIALAAAALVELEDRWLAESGHLGWCHAQLQVAARRPTRPHAFESRRSLFPMGVRRSAARGLPVLLGLLPGDRGLRRSIRTLAQSNSNEVRAFLMRRLSDLWGTDEKLVLDCIGRAAGLALHTAHARSGTGIGRRFSFAPSWRGRSWRRDLHNASPRLIDFEALAGVLFALPLKRENEELLLGANQLDVFDTLMGLSTRIYDVSRRSRLDRNQELVVVPSEWSLPFEQLTANWCLHASWDVVTERILGPMLEDWILRCELIEGVLRQVLLQYQPSRCDRLVRLWRVLSDSRISSGIVDRLPRGWDRELNSALGLLVFHDRSGVVNWDDGPQPPVTELLDVIERWVVDVGHHPTCFESLVGMLRSIGLELMPAHGVSWLTSCLDRAGGMDAMLRRDSDGQMANALSHLLHDAWYADRENLEGNSGVWRAFRRLVDDLAAKAAPIAVQLQRRIVES